MKIKPTSFTPPNQTTGAPGARTTSSNKPAAAQSTVHLSQAAKSASKSVNQDIDMERVEKLRQAIADGSYQVNPDAIAIGLLESAGELLG